jgi:hypothetical protein
MNSAAAAFLLNVLNSDTNVINYVAPYGDRVIGGVTTKGFLSAPQALNWLNTGGSTMNMTMTDLSFEVDSTITSATCYGVRILSTDALTKGSLTPTWASLGGIDLDSNDIGIIATSNATNCLGGDILKLVDLSLTIGE